MCHQLLQEYQFRGIQKAEWNNLFSFIKAKRLKIENVDEVEMGPSGAARPGLDIDLGEDIDTGRALSTTACRLFILQCRRCHCWPLHGACP